ncbi:hypothetical protein FRC01_006165 [Tulasnella sp. 417]|nr:hypothetical protein FRC01_006165 [Tulasnella sp. 417]
MDVTGTEAEQPRQRPVNYKVGTSIQDLPAELLAMILYYTTQTSGPCLPHVQELGTVSSTWREVVKGTPRLWCRVTGDDPPRLIERAIHESKDAPLNIKYDFVKPHRVAKSVVESLWLVCAHIHRWRRARLVMRWTPARLLEALATQKAPLLETFTLQVKAHNGVPPKLFQGAILPLQKLDLYGIPAKGDEDQFKSLRILNIDTQGVSGPSLPSLAAFLQTLPELEEFNFKGTCLQPLAGDSDLSIPYQDPIILPRVTRFSVDTGVFSGVVDISSCLRAPICQEIALEGALVGHSDLSEALSRAVGHFIATIRSTSKLGKCISIVATTSSADLWALNAKLRFSADSRGVEIAHWMIHSIPNSEMEVALHARLPGPSARDLVSVVSVGSSSNVTELDLSDTDDGGSSVLQYLSSPILTIAEFRQWPLPRLENLSVGCDRGGLASLSQMLQIRASGADDMEVSRPAPLKKLKICGDKENWGDNGGFKVEIERLMQEMGGSLSWPVGV